MSGLRRSFYERKEYIAKVADNTEKSGNFRWTSFYQNIISTYHKSNARILEIGCGKAAVSNLIERYIGVDISFTAIKDNVGNFINAEATELPIKNNTFQMLISHRVLEHIHDPEKALLEYRRILGNEGILVLNDAWFCRQYICLGLHKKKYNELSIPYKIYKIFIPIIEFKGYSIPLFNYCKVFSGNRFFSNRKEN